MEVVHGAYFDTLTVKVAGRAADVVSAAREGGVNLHLVDADHVSISCDETTTRTQLGAVWTAFGVEADVDALDAAAVDTLPEGFLRGDDYLTHPVFHAHRSETSMLRYLRKLADRDYALDRGMIPLGSCTMKLNATTEMEPVTWPEFGQLHPFAPADQAQGYLTLIRELEERLAEVTGYDNVSLQPNAGSQGELAGLLAVRGYHRANGDDQRTVCLIPSSAHGTNAASAVMAGMKVVVVKTADDGEIDVADLRAKIEQYADELSVLMITYPSTHGVFEEHVADICAQVHDMRRSGLRRRRQPERPGGSRQAGPLRRRRLAPQPAQDVLHPARRRRPRRRPGRRPRAPRAVPAQPPAAARRRTRDRRRPDLRGSVGLRGHPADLVGVRASHGR